MVKNLSLVVIIASMLVLPMVSMAEENCTECTECSKCSQVAMAASEEGDNEEGFVSLFNGENLDGWLIQGMEKAGPKVEDGIMEVGGWDYWAVITEDTFKDFILRFDVKFYVSPDPNKRSSSNSGILIHTKKKEVFKNETCEIQLAEKVEWDEDKEEYVRVMLPPKKQTGAIVNLLPPKEFVNKPLGEWNSVEIKYEHPKVWVTINDTVVQDGVDLTEVEGIKRVNGEGHLAIQREDLYKAVYYKNIRIKELP